MPLRRRSFLKGCHVVAADPDRGQWRRPHGTHGGDAGDIEHIGSAHDDVRVEVLKAAARQRLTAGNSELEPGSGASEPRRRGAGGDPLPITSSRMGHLLDALAHAYRVLGEDVYQSPQLRDLLVTDASTRGTLAVVTGPSGGDKAEAEQALLDRALIEYAHVFIKSRLWVLDRNLPGVARIKKLVSVTHVLIRLKSDIPVAKIGDFLPDGSFLAGISGGGQTIRMRVIE